MDKCRKYLTKIILVQRQNNFSSVCKTDHIFRSIDGESTNHNAHHAVAPERRNGMTVLPAGADFVQKLAH